jgi:hypothetical protein
MHHMKLIGQCSNLVLNTATPGTQLLPFLSAQPYLAVH